MLGVVWFLPPVATTLLAAVAAALAIFEYCALAKALGIDVQRTIAAVTAVGGVYRGRLRLRFRSTASCS